MPSGAKKRLRAKRRQEESLSTDANSDRETENMSPSGSLDVDDQDSGVDTPRRNSSTDRPSFLDREAVSSQTDEWVRVSDFDVGTPKSGAGDNEPSAEESSSSEKRSSEKLAEWETLSGDNIPEKQEELPNSLEEEPSEVEVASGHSSESYMHLPSPNPLEDKDGDSSDSDRKDRKLKRSSSNSSSSSSSSSEGKSSKLPTETESSAVDPVEEMSSASLSKTEEETGSKDDPVEKEVVHEEAPEETSPAEETITVDPTASHDSPVIDEPVEEKALAATNLDEEKEVSSTSATDVSEVETPLKSEETPYHDDKDVLSIHMDEKVSDSSLGDVEDKEVNGDGSMVTEGDRALEDKEVASTSADLDEEKSKDDAPDAELVNLAQEKLSDWRELAADSLAAKELHTPEGSEPQPSATSADKNGLAKQHPPLEPKAAGCCGVLSWLLGWDH